MVARPGGPSARRIPAWAFGLASALLPGVGQALAGAHRRGLLLLLGFAAAAGLLLWQANIAAFSFEEVAAALSRAARARPILVATGGLLALYYLGVVADAYRLARGKPVSPLPLALLLLATFLGLGWQVGQVDPRALAAGAARSRPALARLLWPWDRAITVPLEQRVIAASIQSPCIDPPPARAATRSGRAALLVEPACGRPSDVTGEHGTAFTISGAGFDPRQAVEIWWRDPLGNEFPQRQGGAPLTFAPGADGSFQVEIVMPFWLLPPPDGDSETLPPWELQARQPAAPGRPVLSRELRLALDRLAETLFIALLATVLGALCALPLAFLGVVDRSGPGRRGYDPTARLARALLSGLRAVPALIWAVIAVIVVGLGPFAGILALTVYSTAALARPLAAALETARPAAEEDRFDWRAAARPLAAAVLARWDGNLRLAAVVGLVGGGGMGFLLAQWLRLQDYAAAGIAIWLSVLTIALLGSASAAIRARYLPPTD